jgi:hypothetical protein
MKQGRGWWIGVVAMLVACGTDEPTEQPAGDDFGRIETDLSMQGDMIQPDMSHDASIHDMSNLSDMTDQGDIFNEPDLEGDMSPDMEASDLDTQDMSIFDMVALPTCEQLINTNNTINVDPSGEFGQYYSRTAFDGQGAWVVYSRPESAQVRDESVFIARFGCDGGLLAAPTMISQGAGFRDLAPSIAVSGELVYVAYQAEETANNTQRVMLRVLRKDGSPVTPEPVEITPLGGAGGQTISTLVWEPDIAALPGGQGALVVASAAVGADATFQIVGQRVDVLGQRAGRGFVVYEEKGVEQHYPSLNISPDGVATIAWTRGNPFDAATARVVWTTLAPGMNTAPAPQAANPGSNVDNQLGALSKEPLVGGEVFLAFQIGQSSGADLGLRELTPGAPLNIQTMGVSNRLDLRPTVSVGPTSGVVGWLRGNTSPTNNLLVLQPFTHTGALQKGQERVIQTADPVRAPFGPGITHVSGTTFFVTWSEGPTVMDPMTGLNRIHARVKGRFVTF